MNTRMSILNVSDVTKPILRVARALGRELSHRAPKLIEGETIKDEDEAK